MLLRSVGLSARPGAIARALEEAGYVVQAAATHPHEPKVTRFERARPNQLWQTDLFTFLLRRENRRVWMVAYLDDHSRFVVGYGIYASSSGALVREVLEAAIANFGAPEELLSDNGPQYHTWRGKSAFTALLERRGIRHIVARPRHPQTLGKVERFWGTLWRELLEKAVFQGLDDARVRIGHFIVHYNFQRTHTGIDGLVPADRYFAAAEAIKQSLKERVAANALTLAQHGAPRKSFYLTGRVGDETIALHAQGGRVVLTKGDGTREEVDLQSEGRRVEPGSDATMPEPTAVCGARSQGVGAEVEESESELTPPGTSDLDDALAVLAQGLDGADDSSPVEREHGLDDIAPRIVDEHNVDDEDDGLAGALVRS
jgi:transposase InsO family protein